MDENFCFFSFSQNTQVATAKTAEAKSKNIERRNENFVAIESSISDGVSVPSQTSFILATPYLPWQI